MMALTSRNILASQPQQELSSRSIKFTSINTNSLVALQRRYDLHNYIAENDFDIVLICKTKLNDGHRLQFANYDFIQVNRSSGKGGGVTAILVKNHFDYVTIHTPSSRDNKIIEYTILKIKIAAHNLYVIAIYANNETSNHFTDELNDLFVKLRLQCEENRYIVAGDFNARHTS